MNKKNTFKNYGLLTFMLLLLFTFQSNAQTDFYTDEGFFGMWTTGSTSEVANPVSDAINSSSTCIQSGAAAWEQVQFFPTYTIQSGDRLYASFHNPNGATDWNLTFVTVEHPWEGINATHDSGSATGWIEGSISLDAYAGEVISKIVLTPAAGEAKLTYIDNIYISSSTVLAVEAVEIEENNEIVYISDEGRIHFSHNQEDTHVFVYDLTGRLVFDEIVNGSESTKGVSIRGTYIIKVVSDSGIVSRKIIY